MNEQIIWLGQAGFILKTEKGTLAVDPFCGTAKNGYERMYPVEVAKGQYKVDAVLTTHRHWDHFDPETYAEYVTPKCIYGPGSCMDALKESGLAIPGKRLDRGQSAEIEGLRVTALPSDHLLDSVSYLVEWDEHRIFFGGDAMFNPTTLIPGLDMRPEISFLCINGKLWNMDFREAAIYARLLGTKVAVPTHYDLVRNNTEDPQLFVRILPNIAPGVKSFVMERGRAYSLEEMLD